MKTGDKVRLKVDNSITGTIIQQQGSTCFVLTSHNSMSILLEDWLELIPEEVKNEN